MAPIIGETPEFLRWAIEQNCPLRDCDQWEDPERTERQLRPLRAYAGAVGEGRLFEGICIDRPAHAIPGESALGFVADEVLNQYGGASFVKSQCGGCWANTKHISMLGTIAGCHGSFVFGNVNELHPTVERVIDEHDLDARVRREFLYTTPRWYGFWIETPLCGERLRLAGELIKSINEYGVLASAFGGFAAAVEKASRENARIHVTCVPRGFADKIHWTIGAHCSRCKAEQREHSDACQVCGRTGSATPKRRRNVRGTRPYWPLAGFLGPENVRDFLARYAASCGHTPPQELKRVSPRIICLVNSIRDVTEINVASHFMKNGYEHVHHLATPS